MSETAPGRGNPAGARLTRALTHALVLVAPVVPIAVTVGSQIRRGWRPTSDDAAIAWRTWDVFSAHAPLVGAFNDATQSATHPVFDPGPLEYYLLAVPDRIDPVHGILWGAALLGVVLVGLAVEAAWRAGRPIAAVAVSAGAVVLTATQSTPMVNLPWNPNIGTFALLTTLVLSAVSATGRLGWWPVAVVTGSLAAQCHLIFGGAALACLVAGAAGGAWCRFSDHRAGRQDVAEPPDANLLRRLLPIALGAGLGLLTLVAPIAQQLSDRPGNVTLLLRNLRHQGQSEGLGFGLRAIDQMAGLPPAWARPAPPISGTDWYTHFLAALFGGSPAAGATILAAATVVAVAAALARRRGLAALAACSALAGLAMAWTFGSIGASQQTVVTYTDVALWPVGMALDATFVWAIAELALALALTPARSGRRAHARPAAAAARLPIVAGGAVLLLTPLVVWSVTTLVPASASPLAVIGGWRVAHAVAPLAADIERHHPRQAVLVEPSVNLFPSGLPTWAVTEALAYQLEVSGLQAKLLPPMQPEIGDDARPGGRPVTFLVVPHAGGHWTVHQIPKPTPTHILALIEPAG